MNFKPIKCKMSDDCEVRLSYNRLQAGNRIYVAVEDLGDGSFADIALSVNRARKLAKQLIQMCDHLEFGKD